MTCGFSLGRDRDANPLIEEQGITRAQEAIETLPSLVIDEVGIPMLLDRMWQLRGHVTAYDAAYAAAAELMACPLVTGDGRLAKAGGVRCEIRLLAAP